MRNGQVHQRMVLQLQNNNSTVQNSNTNSNNNAASASKKGKLSTGSDLKENLPIEETSKDKPSEIKFKR